MRIIRRNRLRYICAVLALCTVLLNVLALLGAGEGKGEGKFDIDGDGSIGISDITMLLNILDKETVTTFDPNHDGALNVADATAILECLSGTTVLAQEGEVKLIHLTTPIGRNETAEVTIRGKPDTLYTIKVKYTSYATAKGLGDKHSDAVGIVTWEWKIGGRTSAGEHDIEIYCGDALCLKTVFETTE